ncbi:bifunctional 5,10-methylenetetrahydrofolate dehydrogenase/5,10-methenyltetrahydrofolate cyclohydrolase, partial [Patescibacteria group bacterium]|nr:bifunctional 5,10-methylenetetrahydrofolate dehydrogenase/5,10-methenyltetrahydrofolate cyclohydrolase [Patescibacteria group bacterium]
INPQKDVDGLHPLNQGLLFSARSKDELGSVLLPCTAHAVLRLIKETGINLEGRKAVIVGRSSLAGKPIAYLLLLENMTVTICHSKTTDLAKETSSADVLVVAAGTPKLISREHVKKGAVVIDVGINRLGDKLVGDVDFEAVKEKVSYITPVPGGVGPLTVAYLLKNTCAEPRATTAMRSA